MNNAPTHIVGRKTKDSLYYDIQGVSILGVALPATVSKILGASKSRVLVIIIHYRISVVNYAFFVIISVNK